VLEATVNSLVIGVGGTMLALVIGGFMAFVTRAQRRAVAAVAVS
jgi:ABC-type spermidine/putrescine transport system permease subunit II